MLVPLVGWRADEDFSIKIAVRVYGACRRDGPALVTNDLFAFACCLPQHRIRMGHSGCGHLHRSLYAPTALAATTLHESCIRRDVGREVSLARGYAVQSAFAKTKWCLSALGGPKPLVLRRSTAQVLRTVIAASQRWDADHPNLCQLDKRAKSPPIMTEMAPVR